jgi:hypothetical protein
MIVKSTNSFSILIIAIISALVIHPINKPIIRADLAARGEAEAGRLTLNLPSTPAVIYVDGDRHIHEIALKGNWRDRDLTAAAGAPDTYLESAQPMAYCRSDGVPMVIFTGADKHIHALYMELSYQGGSWYELWHWADLTNIAGSPPAAFIDPYGYVRSDGISTVVYKGEDGHIHELRLEGTWLWADLTVISGAPVAGPRPVAYVRGDSINSIVYTGLKDHIYELRLEDGWKWADLSDLSGAPLPASDLSAYVRSDGISTIIYIGYDGHVQEIRLESSWIWADLTMISGAPQASRLRPFGYMRGDGINAIVYTADHMNVSDGINQDPDLLYELRLDNGWKFYELTSVQNAFGGTMPVGYIRADEISAIVYLGIDDHIYELRLETSWHWADLTYLAGVPDASGPPWPYNRYRIMQIYLPLLIN